jgi:GNAT superfamily N-acetyltransferase
MRAPGRLVPAVSPVPGMRIDQVVSCPSSFYRYLYAEVGRGYHWVDRLAWTDEMIAAHLSIPGLTLWVLRVQGAPAGYFELRPWDDGSIEIAYFGLLPEFVGKGLGKMLLSFATERAWDTHPTRVWVHTCTFDHPAALPNYLARGFVITHSEQYSVAGLGQETNP